METRSTRRLILLAGLLLSFVLHACGMGGTEVGNPHIPTPGYEGGPSESPPDEGEGGGQNSGETPSGGEGGDVFEDIEDMPQPLPPPSAFPQQTDLPELP